jgi:hypothetical protein
MSKAPFVSKAGAAPRKAAPRKPAARGKGGSRGMMRAAWIGGPSWLAVAVIVLVVLVVLPVAAAVLGDVWAVVLAALAGGFALGRATAR